MFQFKIQSQLAETLLYCKPGYWAGNVPVKEPLIELPSTVLLPRVSSVAPVPVESPAPFSLMVELETRTVAPEPSA